MDDFGDLTKAYGIKPQGKSAPMASSKQSNDGNNKNHKSTSSSSSSFSSFNDSSSSLNHKRSTSGSGSFSFSGNEIPFGSTKKNHNFNGLDDYNDNGLDFFSGFQKNSTNNANGSSADDLFSGFNATSNSNINNNTDDFFGSFVSKPSDQSAPGDDLLGDFSAGFKPPPPPTHNVSFGSDDLIPGFGNGSTISSNKGENTGMNNSTYTSADEPFVMFEQTSTTTNMTSTDPYASTDDPFAMFERTSTTTNATSKDPLEEFRTFSHSRSTKPAGSSNIPSPLKPPPRPGQSLKSDKTKSSNVSFLDELEEFGMAKVRNSADGRSEVHQTKEARDRQSTKANRYKEAEDATRKNQQASADDIEAIFGMGHRSSSAPKSRAASVDPLFDATINRRGEPAVSQNKSSSASSGIRKASSTTSIVDDLPSMFGDFSMFGGFEEVEGESEDRRRARFERHQRTQDRMAKAVADMNQRDFRTQQEQEERHRLADQMDLKIKQWSEGKEGNMRALLSSLQKVLWPQCGWEPVSLADLIASTSVKKVHRKATLCVHPDKVQQKGATLEQKYIAEKVFDILQESWKKFEKEELS